MRLQLSGLWRHPDFLKLWAGQTISLFGSQITSLALPLTAVLTLQATPTQMGMLRATHSASAMLAGLFAGVWADRLRRRPILNGINLVSLRQAMTPTQLQGRMNATFRFLNMIAVTIGALLAGAFSGVIGLHVTLAVGACGLFIPFLRLFFSPARNLQKAEPTA